MVNGRTDGPNQRSGPPCRTSPYGIDHEYDGFS